MRNYYSKDPRWIMARFRSTCHACDMAINKGEDLFYFPLGKKAYCKECGEIESNRFELEAIDEYNYNH